MDPDERARLRMWILVTLASAVFWVWVGSLIF